ncbi:hypothetical protein BaRGS_00035317 [Batillaria attramentaria]|uniref:Uncharacterized protein n=1 Tax=Batillaria attramentaria TaxID=370345 RepID=A0ABD0JEM3_9CAEN
MKIFSRENTHPFSSPPTQFILNSTAKNPLRIRNLRYAERKASFIYILCDFRYRRHQRVQSPCFERAVIEFSHPDPRGSEVQTTVAPYLCLSFSKMFQTDRPAHVDGKAERGELGGGGI